MKTSTDEQMVAISMHMRFTPKINKKLPLIHWLLD